MSLMLSVPSVAVSELIPAGDSESALAVMKAVVWQLQRVRTLQEAQEIEARAIAIDAYVNAKEQTFGEEIRLRSRAVTYIAARRVGEFLHHSQRARGGRPKKTGSPVVPQKTLKDLGIQKKDSALAQQLFALPLDLFELLLDNKDMTLAKAQYIARRRVEHKTLIDVDVTLPPYVCDIRAAGCRGLFASGIRPDAVITRPASDEASLPLFSELTRACLQSQVPIVAVAISPRYLPAVLQRLDHLPYQTMWTGDDIPPVLIFSTPEGTARRQNMGSIKRYPDWIRRAVEGLTLPGQLVCDPFLQGASVSALEVAITALDSQRQFVGAHPDASIVDKAREEIEQELTARHRARCVYTHLRRADLGRYA